MQQVTEVRKVLKTNTNLNQLGKYVPNVQYLEKPVSMYLKSHYQHQLKVHRANIWKFTKDSPEVVGDVVPTKNVDVETSMENVGENLPLRM